VTGAALILAVLVAVAVHAGWKTITERVHRVGLSRILVRFVRGRPWHGEPLTDAGFIRKGHKALTKTGHASRFAHRPEWQRILMRLVPLLAVVFGLYGLLYYRLFTVRAGEAATAAVAVWLGLLAWFRLRRSAHRRRYLSPLHAALAPHLKVALPAKPESWLKVAHDRSWARITLPASFDANPRTMDAIYQAASARLGMRNADPTWKLAGRKPMLVLEAAQPPPKRVILADVMDQIKAARDDELILGMAGRGKIARISLHNDSPHIGLSVSSGGGKSVTAELLAAQAAYRGAIVLILDFPKLVSLPALRHLPNVAYADSGALVHSALVWLARDLETRASLVKAHTDYDGIYRGPRLERMLVVCEESNALMDRLGKYWSDVREPGDPKRSPAIDGLELALLMGRQLYINIVQIGQFLSVRATGSGAARENLGVRILGRATMNNWKILVPEHAYPGKTKRPGRVHVVTDSCDEVQLVKIEHREARQLATAGTVTPCPDSMPGRQRVPGPGRPPLRGPDQHGPNGTGPLTGPVVSDAVPVLDGGLSIKEAIGLGILPGTIDAERKAMQRAKTAGTWPRPIGNRGLARVWDPADLAEWVQRRDRERAG
jgi:hypothetical protein